jgi:hypothetical protein
VEERIRKKWSGILPPVTTGTAVTTTSEINRAVLTSGQETENIRFGWFAQLPHPQAADSDLRVWCLPSQDAKGLLLKMKTGHRNQTGHKHKQPWGRENLV